MKNDKNFISVVALDNDEFTFSVCTDSIHQIFDWMRPGRVIFVHELGTGRRFIIDCDD